MSCCGARTSRNSHNPTLSHATWNNKTSLGRSVDDELEEWDRDFTSLLQSQATSSSAHSTRYKRGRDDAGPSRAPGRGRATYLGLYDSSYKIAPADRKKLDNESKLVNRTCHGCNNNVEDARSEQGMGEQPCVSSALRVDRCCQPVPLAQTADKCMH